MHLIHPFTVSLMSVTKLAVTRLFFVVSGNAAEELFRHNQQQCIKQSTFILIKSSHLFFRFLLILFNCSIGLMSKLIITVAKFSKQNKRSHHKQSKRRSFCISPFPLLEDLNTKRVFADEKRITVSFRNCHLCYSPLTQQE
jgi:hypothetical protein